MTHERKQSLECSSFTLFVAGQMPTESVMLERIPLHILGDSVQEHRLPL